MQEFRRYIVALISRTKYGQRNYSEEKLPAIAKMLGVDMDALLEARILYRERQHAIGAATGRGDDYRARSSRDKSDVAALCYHMTKEVKQFLQEYSDTRKVPVHILLRSVIHHYLLGSWEPPVLHQNWMFTEIPRDRRQGRDAIINVTVTPAARLAVWMRSEMLQVSAEQLGRSLIVDTVSGRFARPGEISYITRRHMFSDIARYRTRFEEGPQIPKELD